MFVSGISSLITSWKKRFVVVFARRRKVVNGWLENTHFGFDTNKYARTLLTVI